MATSESKGELVIPITVVQSLLLLRRPFVPKIRHVEHRRVTVNLMTQTCVPRTILLHISMDNTAAKLIKKE